MDTKIMDSLIQKHLDGQTSAEEADALSSQIVADAEVRTRSTAPSPTKCSPST